MMSLNQRILSSAFVVLILFVVGTAITLDRAFQDNALAALQDRMLGKLYLLMGDAEVDLDGNLTMPEEFPGFPQISQIHSGTAAFITDGTQKLVWQSLSALYLPALPTNEQMTDQQQFKRLIMNDTPYFLYHYPVQWETEAKDYPFVFHLLMDSSLFDDQRDQYENTLWSWLAAIALLLLVVQAVALRWGLLPMRKVAGELNRIEAGQQENLGGRYPVELSKLTDNINSLIHHERKYQQRYRNALADLAHSLKTPLAILQGAIKTETDPRKLKLLVAQQIERMDNIVQYQLRRAATIGKLPGARLIRLQPIIEKIVNAVSRAHYSKQPRIDIEVDSAISLQINESDLLELLGNLVDNAFKWCRERVTITACHQQDKIVIKISDDGPDIPATESVRILQRGVRGDSSVPGHGIGLAIVQDILQANDGQLTVVSEGAAGKSFVISFSQPFKTHAGKGNSGRRF
ncbi:ATP-binding protein [Nitrosomonas mobilis]|uniref:histidine kinase n=1 Tax=Nitrosomonas mobilis TaxID=51642 RepID=A0A1G5SD15_9PROT|nr:ATP-binding protein [Nitrosomonas mobilis]SCZ84421.1 Integral membrane sensor signal transduction histidine kinase [Nitrosomonas mobilis]HNO75184.1 ATP-binding protein [Nitrosomonas mobilis]